jgi:hypothetical protein
VLAGKPNPADAAGTEFIRRPDHGEVVSARAVVERCWTEGELEHGGMLALIPACGKPLGIGVAGQSNTNSRVCHSGEKSQR